MRKRREINVFSISFLDLLSGALGAVIILYVAMPKNQPPVEADPVKQMMQQDLVQLQSQLQKSQITIEELQKKLTETMVSSQAKEEPKPEPVKKQEGADLDIGFKFKGRNIVFLIDTSYSMTEEDRMGQVKAGLKMLLTSLTPAYRIDVVQFPFGMRAPFRTMWGATKENRGMNKMDAFDFIYALKPDGGTPTRDALLFVLKNYEDMTDLVLLSDGAPTLHNSNKKDDIYDIMRVVREENRNKVQINSIGVGSDFIRDKTSERYKFLSLLAEETGGFFVGF